MRVLGIDPGSETTGWGILEGNGPHYALVEFGTVKTSSHDKFPDRLLKICIGIEAVIARLQPDTCAIEDGFLKTNVKTTLKLGQARGVVLLSAARAMLDIHEYSPRLVKQTVVGHGNAEKYQVQEMVRVLLSLKTIPEPHDAADALAVAICHFHHAGIQQRILAADARVRPTSSTTLRRRAAP